MPKAIEALWNYLEKRHLIKTLPAQHILTFALSMGIIALCYGDGTAPKTIKGLTQKGCNTLWADNSKGKIKNMQ